MIEMDSKPKQIIYHDLDEYYKEDYGEEEGDL
jgi:hypothetical protein